MEEPAAEPHGEAAAGHGLRRAARDTDPDPEDEGGDPARKSRGEPVRAPAGHPPHPARSVGQDLERSTEAEPGGESQRDGRGDQGQDLVTGGRAGRVDACVGGRPRRSEEPQDAEDEHAGEECA